MDGSQRSKEFLFSLLLFFFYFLCCKCFREIYKCKLHFFLLNMTLWSYILYFYSTYCFTIDHCFTISCFSNKIYSKQGVIPQYISIDLPVMHIVQIWLSVDIGNRAFENVPNVDITGHMTPDDFILQLQNYNVYLQQRSL